MAEHPTYCRICESACGLVATVEEGRVTALRPDMAHPVSKGYACIKGTRFHERHYAPERLRHPWVRGEGDVSWLRALAFAGERIRALVDEHGPESVGIYAGNAAGHSLGTVLGLTALQRGLRTTKHYTCLTLDNAPMFAVTEACLGNPLRTFVADYAASDCLVLLGTDPLISQPSQAQSHPDGVREIREAAGRGVLTVVDPRRSATARRASVHLQPRPGSDVALLAYCVRRVLDARHTGSYRALRACVERFDVQTTARWTRLGTEAIEALATSLLDAERPLVWSGLGILLGPSGTVGYWLTLCLQELLGGLGTLWIPQSGAVDLASLSGVLGVRGLDASLRSRIGDYRAVLGTLAAATLPDDILTPGKGQLRALIVVGGNPLRALPDSRRAREALDRLQLLVSVDLFSSGTTELADVRLPACSWLAREESAVHMATQRRLPHLQRTQALVPPEGEARPDWEILTDLCRSAGGVPFGSRLASWAVGSPRRVERLAVGLRGAVRWADLGGRGAMGKPAPVSVTVTLEVPEFLEALETIAAPEPGMRLVTSVRATQRMNTWLSPRADRARAHPRHAGPVRLTGPGGSLELVLEGDATLPEDVIVLPFGGVGPNPTHSSPPPSSRPSRDSHARMARRCRCHVSTSSPISRPRSASSRHSASRAGRCPRQSSG